MIGDEDNAQGADATVSEETVTTAAADAGSPPMLSAEMFSILDAHMGRAGDNQFDIVKMVEISSALLDMEASGAIIITDIDPAAKGGETKNQYLSKFVDKIDKKQIVPISLESLAVAKVGHNRVDGVRFTYQDEDKVRHLSVKWKAA